ncbi:AlpA family transcriptional regulator [Vibrio vulnificus]|uniref:helix-turn-helix transcriptional regulator n=1 Tax=Vibrio vulnificus TaxID=672 RepID=UPI001A32857D|nr:AlpA family transcriptional regulator [Vibrio vulnificus]EHZ2539408.1 AlpA family transcriptional regulator [Vibrio parahaemolyticus]EHH1180607.1 AlpA family transcriptional regulator [Vibrio vulnificus]EHH1188654.1 AlpA family transcriptional regulator [Vibrio vulnificus]EHU4846327.1 AlpA family transcriptional regulator [Vibrio vulnificus]EHZ2900090.1 AlpA family transcriptional regulator [Vibrio vulnificus]
MTTRLIRIDEVKYLTGLSRATIYRYMKNNMFPHSINLGSGATCWSSEEVQTWIAERIAERDSKRQ